MIRYELVNAETQVPMGGIVLQDEDTVLYGHDLTESSAFVMQDSDDEGPALIIGVDPTYRGGLLLVSYDMDGRELDRAPVPEEGERPAALIAVE